MFWSVIWAGTGMERDSIFISHSVISMIDGLTLVNSRYHLIPLSFYCFATRSIFSSFNTKNLNVSQHTGRAIASRMVKFCHLIRFKIDTQKQEKKKHSKIQENWFHIIKFSTRSTAYTAYNTQDIVLSESEKENSELELGLPQYHHLNAPTNEELLLHFSAQIHAHI